MLNTVCCVNERSKKKVINAWVEEKRVSNGSNSTKRIIKCLETHTNTKIQSNEFQRAYRVAYCTLLYTDKKREDRKFSLKVYTSDGSDNDNKSRNCKTDIKEGIKIETDRDWCTKRGIVFDEFLMDAAKDRKWYLKNGKDFIAKIKSPN